AYAIHLDVNAKQSKGKYDANWGKLTELATDFETSPLFVFAYLNRWVRRQGVDTARIEKIKLYAYDFYPCFDPYCTYNSEQETLDVEEKSSLNHPLNLTILYREFYLAHKKYNPSSNSVLKPIDIAADAILKGDQCFEGDQVLSGFEENYSGFQIKGLVGLVAAKVVKLMDQVHRSTAEGRWVLKNREHERQAILKFAEYFVVEVFEKSFGGDRARLAGKQLNLIRDTCEFLYRLANDQENKDSSSKSPENLEEASPE
ncbi:MAG: type I-D CRISPR-associated protein Cas10d/Csc3, partial [Planktothrix sp.]